VTTPSGARAALRERRGEAGGDLRGLRLRDPELDEPRGDVLAEVRSQRLWIEEDVRRRDVRRGADITALLIPCVDRERARFPMMPL
jgi:hypothetical protein